MHENKFIIASVYNSLRNRKDRNQCSIDNKSQEIASIFLKRITRVLMRQDGEEEEKIKVIFQLNNNTGKYPSSQHNFHSTKRKLPNRKTKEYLTKKVLNRV